jgi:hypothetical protein
MKLLLETLIAVACSSYYPETDCKTYLAKCHKEGHKEGMKAEWSQKYEPEYRKAVVFETCRAKSGYKIR